MIVGFRLLKNKLFIALLSITLILSGCSKEPTDFSIVKNLEKSRVLSEVKKYSDLEPITVTASISDRSVGTKHDFYSEGDYWWPNPKYPDSAFIRKDGMTNPDNFVAHRRAMIRLSQLSGAFASAYLVTKDKEYLNQLLPHLEAWFVDPSTKMNPHLLYAQAIKGRYTGRGIGIIDTIHLIEVSLAIEVIEDSEEFPQQNIDAIKKWFSQYLEWMTTHEYGIKERDNGNNHSTCWAMQVAAFARLTNNIEQFNFCKDFYKKELLPNQMADNGSFPKELARTKPYGYSIFNLDAMSALAQLLTNKKDNVFQYETKNEKSLKLGIEFLHPYLKDKQTWPYKQDVMYWNDWPTKQSSLLFGGLQLDNQSYIDTWVSLPEIPNKAEIIRNMPVRNPLIWIN